jgi:hypothetical protein
LDDRPGQQTVRRDENKPKNIQLLPMAVHNSGLSYTDQI